MGKTVGNAGNRATPSGEGGGIMCRKCGCRHVPVVATRRRRGQVVRKRVCRHCGHKMVTREKMG